MIETNDLQSQIDEVRDRLDEHQHDNFDNTQKIKRTILVTFNVVGGGCAFIATSPCVIKKVYEMHELTATGATVVEKLTGTTFIGLGTSILTTNFALSTTRDTVQIGVLTNPNGIYLAKGDRIGVWQNGSYTGIVNQNITFEIEM